MELYRPDERIGVKNESQLASAIEHAKAAAGEANGRAKVCGKAAALFHSLAQNHAFYNGNECTALATLSFFLRYNGYRFEMATEEEIQFTHDVANNLCTLEQVTSRISRDVHEI